jgi:hypothetical protein
MPNASGHHLIADMNHHELIGHQLNPNWFTHGPLPSCDINIHWLEPIVA